MGPAEAEAEMIECCKGQVFRARLRFYPMPEINLPDLRSIDINCRDADPRDLISLSLLELVNFQIPDGLVREALALDGIEVKPGSDAWQVASDQVRLMLILKRVARQEGIEVDQTDVEKRISEKAREFGTTDKSLKVELENGGGMQRLKEMLIAESTLEYILEINSK